MKTKIALLTNSLSGGGMERAIVNIANLLVFHGYSVDLLLAACKGVLFEELDSRVNVVCLDNEKKYSIFQILINSKIGKLRFNLFWSALFGGTPKALKRINPISRYISDVRPALILSTPMTANIAVVMAVHASQYKPAVILREASTLSEETKHAKGRFFKKISKRINHYYSKADRIICVSNGVKIDLVENYGVHEAKCLVVKNPINEALLIEKSEDIDELKAEYNRELPFILAMGRLEEQKDFKTLLNAFSMCSDKINQNLLILGEGSQRQELEVLVKVLGVDDRVFMPGYVNNPYPYLSKCDLFILSSRWEGLANVLREAMVFNKKIIATDCPSGTREILASYDIGEVVPMGDFQNMSQLIVKLLLEENEKTDTRAPTSKKLELTYLDVIGGEISKEDV